MRHHPAATASRPAGSFVAGQGFATAAALHAGRGAPASRTAACSTSRCRSGSSTSRGRPTAGGPWTRRDLMAGRGAVGVFHVPELRPPWLASPAGHPQPSSSLAAVAGRGLAGISPIPFLIYVLDTLQRSAWAPSWPSRPTNKAAPAWRPRRRIRVQLDYPPPHFLIKAEAIMASPDQSDDDSEDNVLDYEGTVTVFTNGLKLTDAQTETMNNRVLARGIGMGAILVHKLTESDVHNNGLHIPKRIVSALKINKKGWVILRIGHNDNHIDAKYYRSTDGRIKFTTGWTSFVDEFDIEAGLVVLVMFSQGR